MNLGFFGTDYKRTSIQEMELIYLNKESWPSVTHDVVHDSPIDELVILATCNRFEMYYVSQNTSEATQWIVNFISRWGEIPHSTLRSIGYTLEGDAVLRHLLNVAAGVESMVFGEDEILSQVKDAYHQFSSLNSTGPILNKVFQIAIATGKRVRHETEISRGSYSVSSIAVDAIRETIFDYFDKSIIVIGTGKIGNRAVKKLAAIGHPNLYVSNRTHMTAMRVGTESNCQVIPFDTIRNVASNFHIIIVATGSSDFILSKGNITKHAVTELIIDLAVPRNVDPLIESSTCRIIGVGGLQAIADKNVLKRQKESAKVTGILTEEQNRFNLWLDRRSVYH